MTATIKKTVTLIMTLCIVMGLMAGCVIEQQDENFTLVNTDDLIEIGPVPDHDWQEITITVMGAQGSTNDWGSTQVVKAMKEKFGVTMKCTPYSSDD